MMLAPHSARRVETRRAEWARRSWSALLRHSSDSVAAPSQQRCAQHQLRRSSISSTRRAEWARRSWSAHIRRSSDSVAAATPSQLRRSSAARTMSGRRGIGRSSPSGKFANFWAKTGVHRHDTTLLFNILISLKSLGHSPAPGFFFGGGLTQ